jgi:molybdopterin molybdotransferase
VIGFHEAVAAVAARTAPAGEEEVILTAAAGRILAGPLVARLDLPRFDATAMDGWAIRREGSFPARLRILGTLAAGRVSDAGVGPGQALKIMTGAPIPPGADAVVPVEEAREEAGVVIVPAAPRALAHVRRRGEIFAAGAQVLDGGCVLTPSRLAVAVSAGHAKLRVVRRPRAGLLVTGEEIAPAGTEPGPGKIPNSNGPLLQTALTQAGARVTDLGVSRDDEAELTARRQAGAAAGLDLLVTTGGVSTGDFDLVSAALNSLGAEIVFHKVAIRPAKPVLFARLGATLVFGLPGNPVSAAVGFDFFVRAALRTMAGLSPLPAPFAAALLAPIRNAGGRLALLPGRLHFAGGTVAVEPVTTHGSHDILAHARSDALFVVPGETSLRAGEVVEVYPSRDL